MLHYAARGGLRNSSEGLSEAKWCCHICWFCRIRPNPGVSICEQLLILVFPDGQDLLYQEKFVKVTNSGSWERVCC